MKISRARQGPPGPAHAPLREDARACRCALGALRRRPCRTLRRSLRAQRGAVRSAFVDGVLWCARLSRHVSPPSCSLGALCVSGIIMLEARVKCMIYDTGDV